MGKKDKKNRDKVTKPALSVLSATQSQTPAAPIISKRGWKIIGAGVAVAVAGYIVLSFTDPRGQNAASTISPFLIIAGYVLVGFGIVARDPSPPRSTIGTAGR